MRHALVITILFSLSLIGAAQSKTQNKPLKPAFIAYDFIPNMGSGENGSLVFSAPGIGGFTVAGTGDPWTFVGGSQFAAGDTFTPSVYIFPGEGCGYLDVASTTYAWGSFCDDPAPITINITAIQGEPFTFPRTLSTTAGTWSVQVPAKLLLWYGTEGLPTIKLGETSWRLLVTHGTWTLTWYYVPPDEQFPAGSYWLQSGYFSGQSQIGKHQIP
jgi:hypothetical protein